jgi:hypothetical protein
VAFYRRGRIRKLAHAQESLVGAELVLEREFLLKGGAVIGNGSISQEVRPEDKMATDLQNGDTIVLSFPHFFFIMMRIGTEDQELEQSISLLAASSWQGVLYGAGSSDSCGILVGALVVVLRAVLERLISMEVQLVKFLISNSGHAV